MNALNGEQYMRRQIPMIFLGLILGGCATAPSINVLGAYFPDWMFCIVGGILATSTIHAMLRARGLLANAGRFTLPVAYAALITTLALVGWLTFFKN
jgi:hypothetical protein